MCTEGGRMCDACLETRLATPLRSDCIAAWGDWYARDYALVSEFVRRRLQGADSRELAEDIVQETFIIGFKLMTRQGHLQHGNNLCGILIGVAKNLILQASRAQHRRMLPLDESIAEGARGLAADDALLVEDVRGEVLAIFKAQKECNRALLYALYVEQRPIVAVARELHQVESNVRLLAHRAIARIARELHRRTRIELSPKGVRLVLTTFSWADPGVARPQPPRYETARTTQFHDAPNLM